jgi:hypothetical protein
VHQFYLPSEIAEPGLTSITGMAVAGGEGAG